MQPGNDLQRIYVLAERRLRKSKFERKMCLWNITPIENIEEVPEMATVKGKFLIGKRNRRLGKHAVQWKIVEEREAIQSKKLDKTYNIQR